MAMFARGFLRDRKFRSTAVSATHGREAGKIACLGSMILGREEGMGLRERER